jgi:surface protein
VAGVSVTNVNITGQLINLDKIFVDDVYEIEADITPANATNKNVTWTSSNPSVASVTPDANNGLKATVTALTTGSTRITVRTQDGNKSDSIDLTIHNAPSGMFQVIETEDTANGTYTTVTIYNHHVPGSSWLGPYDNFNATPVNGGLSYQYLNGSSPNKIVIAEDLYPTSLEDAFYELTDLDTIEGLNKVHTAGITSMSHMFYWCELLDGTLDLSSFDTSSVTDMTGMFDHCSNVDAIVVSNLFVVSQVTDSTDMFYSCYDLVGGAGTATGNSSDYFNITSNSDKTYARIDGGTSNPGYFTGASSSSTSSIYWAVTGTAGNQTLTFYNTAGTGRTAIAADASYDYGNSSNSFWETNGETITSIDFAEEIRPTSLEGWFANMSGIGGTSDFTHLSNLNTSNVTSMAGMFFGCNNITSLDLSSLDTSSVTSMREMFQGCESLQTINLSGFDTSSVRLMDFMFYYCEMIEEIDVSSFNTSSVSQMQYMFANCYELTTIYASSDFVTTSTMSSGGDGMFTGSTNLRGGYNTAYSSSHVDKTYACIDAAGTPGYFTARTSSSSGHSIGVSGNLLTSNMIYVNNSASTSAEADDAVEIRIPYDALLTDSLGSYEKVIQSVSVKDSGNNDIFAYLDFDNYPSYPYGASDCFIYKLKMPDDDITVEVTTIDVPSSYADEVCFHVDSAHESTYTGANAIYVQGGTVPSPSSVMGQTEATINNSLYYSAIYPGVRVDFRLQVPDGTDIASISNGSMTVYYERIEGTNYFVGYFIYVDTGFAEYFEITPQ